MKYKQFKIAIIILFYLIAGYNALAEQKTVKPSFSYELLDTTLTSHKKLWKAQIYITESKPDKGIPLLISLINDKENNDDLRDFCTIYLAEAYRKKLLFQQGIDLLYDLLSKKNISNRNKSLVYNRLAAMYDENPDYRKTRIDSVLKYSNLSLKIAEKNNYFEIMASSWNELGYLYSVKNDNPEKAIYYYSQALNLFNDLGIFYNSINTVFNITDVYIHINQPLKADSVLSMFFSYSIPDDNDYLYMNFFERQAKINFDLENYKQAFLDIEEAYYYEKSFFKNRLNKQITDLSAKYNLQQEKQKIVLANQKAKQKELQNKIIIITSVFFAVLLVLSIVVIDYKHKLTTIENEKLKNKLEEKNRQLLFTLSDIIIANKVYSDLKVALKNIKSDEIAAILNNYTVSEHNWIKFYENFESIYPNFFNEILSRYPHLTKNEQKLSAMLLMNITTQQIAKLLNISSASVSKNRNRLRKKLNLKQGDNLHLFMKKICDD